MMIRRVLGTISIFLIYICSLYGQEDVLFYHLTIQDGLSQSVVSDIVQDKNGYLWIGTLEGLNRYDGYQFKNFLADPEDPNTLSDGSISCLLADKSENFLWIGTSNGLNKYDLERSVITRYFGKDDSELSNSAINDLFQDKDGDLWIATQDGLCKYNYLNNKFETVDLPFLDNAEKENITSLLFDSRNRVWIGTDNGLFILTRYLSNEEDLEWKQITLLTDKDITKIYQDQDGYIWVGTQNGLNKYDGEFNRISHYIDDEFTHESISNGFIRDIAESPNGQLWIATEDGLNKYIKESGSFEKYYSDLKNNSESLLSNIVRSMYFDHTGLFWVGTVGGLNKHHDVQKGFINYTLFKNKRDVGSYSESSKTPVWYIFEDSKSNFWIATMNQGLLKFSSRNLSSESLIQYEELPDENRTMLNTVFNISEDEDRNLYLGTDQGLVIYNPISNKVARIRCMIDDSCSLSNGYVLYQQKDFRGNLWIGTLHGLNIFDPSTNEVKRFYLDIPGHDTQLTNFISAFLLDDQKLWIGTNDGLHVLDLEMFYSNGKFIYNSYYHSAGDSGSLPASGIQTIMKDKNGTIWVGSKKGISRLDSTTDEFITYDNDNGLYNEIIYGIIEHDEYFWLSTNYGLSKFNTKSYEFINYDDADGLLNLEFNSGAYFEDSKGYLYFGGLDGVTCFHPDSIYVDTIPPQIAITDIKIYQESIGPGKKIGNDVITTKTLEYTNEIKLNHKQRYLSFEFAALHFRDIDNNYRYKLSGLEDDWIYSRNRNYVNYTNLDPDKYEFIVQAANSDGFWNTDGKSIKIEIKSPLWRTSWFYIILSGSILLFIYLFIKIREKSLKQSKVKLKQEVELRTKEIAEAQEELIQSNTFIESIISNAIDGIVVTDFSRNIQLVNKAFTEMTLYSEDELLNMNIKDITPKDWLVKEERLIETIRKGEAVYIEKEYIRKDNTIFQASITAAPLINENSGNSVIAIIRDISKEKKQQAELNKHRNHLEQLVEDRTKELQNAKEKAEMSDKLKSSFLANMSHEIRTPMNAIVGFAQLLSNKMVDDSQKDTFYDLIIQNSNTLLHLIENIIDLSRIESGEVDFILKPCYVNDVMRKVYEEHQNHFATTKVGVEFDYKMDSEDPKFQITTDESRLKLVFKNLIENAIKFTEKGRIEFGYILDSEEKIKFYVSDTGIGISKDKHALIFSHFTKIEEDSVKLFRGTGLGLALVKKILDLLNGEIWVDSEEFVGSTFYFTLPNNQTEKKKDDDMEVDLNAYNLLEGKSILVVEDEENNYYFLEEVLSRLKVSIDWAKNGKEAVDKFEIDQNYDLILMDIKMPVMNGYDATKLIKKMNPQVPIIAQTAYAMPGERNEILEAGCDDYLAKPIVLDEFVEKVIRFLQKDSRI